MVVKHLSPEGGGWRREEGGGRREEEGGRREERGDARHLLEPIEQLKRGCFALLAGYNESACGRHVYSQKEWERRKKWEGK